MLMLSEGDFKIALTILFKKIKEVVDNRNEKMTIFNGEFNLLKRI